MSDAAAPTNPAPANVAALVEAIDARARQAGTEGATTILRGMIGSISEVLAGLQQRLDHVDELLVDRNGAGTIAEQVQAGLATFNTRLGRLEEAFVQAVEDSGSGTDAVVEQIRQVVVASLQDQTPAATTDDSQVVRQVLDTVAERLDAIDAALDRPRPEPEFPSFPDVAVAVGDGLEPLGLRLAAIEQLIRSRAADEPPDATPAVRAALAPVLERLDDLEMAVRSATANQDDGRLRVDGALAGLPDRLASLDERLRGLAAASMPAEAPLDADLVARLEDAVDQLSRGEASARLVALVEERLGAAVRAVAERADATRRSVDELHDRLDDDQGRLSEVASTMKLLAASSERLADDAAEAVTVRMTARLAAVSDRLSGLDARLDGAEKRQAGIADSIAAVHGELAARGSATAADASGDDRAGQLAERVTEAMRREAELITQRVAALAVGVEAARALLEQHVEETENSLGRKASEVTRKLAADLGIRGVRRQNPGGRRDPREIGPGA